MEKEEIDEYKQIFCENHCELKDDEFLNKRDELCDMCPMIRFVEFLESKR